MRKDTSLDNCFPLKVDGEDKVRSSFALSDSFRSVFIDSVSCVARAFPNRSVNPGAYMAARSELMALVRRKLVNTCPGGKVGGFGSDGT